MREGDTSFLSPLLVEIILSLCLGIFLTSLIHILHVQVFVLQIFSLVGIQSGCKTQNQQLFITDIAFCFLFFCQNMNICTVFNLDNLNRKQVGNTL